MKKYFGKTYLETTFQLPDICRKGGGYNRLGPAASPVQNWRAMM